MNKIFAVASVVIKELYRRKDFYVLFILTALITLLSGSVTFFHDDRIVRYLKEICLVLIWLSALVMVTTTAARQIPFERENRTIFPLLAKPISRWQVLAGKFLGCWLASGLVLLVFYLFFAVVNASREHTFPIGNYLQVLWMHWQLMGIVAALTILGSITFTAPSSNITIILIVTLGILFVGPHLHKVALRMAEPSSSIATAVYYVIPHLEFYDLRSLIIHDWPMVGWVYIGAATAYAWLYTAFFLVAACLVFRRKALN